MKTTRYQFETIVQSTTDKNRKWSKKEFRAILNSDKNYTRKTDYKLIKQSKIQVYKLLTPEDFVNINGVGKVKRDALIKTLLSLPISYNWKIINKHLSKKTPVLYL